MMTSIGISESEGRQRRNGRKGRNGSRVVYHGHGSHHPGHPLQLLVVSQSGLGTGQETQQQDRTLVNIPARWPSELRTRERSNKR